MSDEKPRSLSRRHMLDGATWSAPAPLGELSEAQRSTSVPCPDFTRGAWSGKRT